MIGIFETTLTEGFKRKIATERTYVATDAIRLVRTIDIPGIIGPCCEIVFTDKTSLFVVGSAIETTLKIEQDQCNE
jgi:hypothetical protein